MRFFLNFIKYIIFQPLRFECDDAITYIVCRKLI